MNPTRAGHASAWTAACLALVSLAGCIHHHAPPPGPGTSQGTPPDLRGVAVMVFPVQRTSGVMGDVDAEIAFGLRGHGAGVDWIFPPALRDAMRRAPNLNTRIRGLPVDEFAGAEVHRVGDPLYGELRRLAALVNAKVAFIPLTAASVPQTGGGTAVEMSAALIDVRSGYVLWFGVVKGDVRRANGPAVLASAVDVLARKLLWYEGGKDGNRTDTEEGGRIAEHVEARGGETAGAGTAAGDAGRRVQHPEALVSHGERDRVALQVRG